MSSPERQFGPSRSSRASPEGMSRMSPAPGTQEGQAFGPPSQEAVTYSWSHANMKYLPNEAKKEAEVEVQAAKREARHWSDAAKEWERRCDEADGRRKEAEVEAMRKVHQVSWTSVRQAAEYEERIKVLEELVEEERAKHEEALQNHQRLAQEAVDESRDLAKETELRYARLLANANARATDAEERAEAAMRRAEDEVKAAKAREEDRVQEIRKWADARVRECADQKAFEIQQMHEKLTQRQRQMEETLYLNGRQRSEALSEAKRHTASVEQDALEWKAMKEMEFARKEARIEEWTSNQRRQNESLQNQHKGLLDLEKALHNRTMERTMQRVNRQIEYGDAATTGRDTPTRQAIQDLPASEKSGGGLPGLTASSPLKLAGGSLASG